MTDFLGAYQEEQNYIRDRKNGIDTSLPDRLAPYGYTLEEYHKVKPDGIWKVINPKVLEGGVPSAEYVIYLAKQNPNMLYFPTMENYVAMVGAKGEIYPEKAKELGVGVIYTDFQGGTVIDTPAGLHVVLAILDNHDVRDVYFMEKVYELFLKYEPTAILDKNDIMLDGKKVAGTSVIKYNDSLVFGMTMAFEDVTELAKQIIPPRSIKEIGFANIEYREKYKEDIIEAFNGVR